MSTSTQKLGLSCPKGGVVYVCDQSDLYFIGCCTSNPCNNGGICPNANLRTTSFSQDYYRDIPEQACQNAGDSGEPDGLWYTCKNIDTPFMGCCTGNPCQENGCPQKNLTAARLSDDPDKAARFKNPESDDDSSQASITPGAIAGICIGAVALIILGVIAWIMVRRRNRSAQNEKTPKNPDEASNLYSPNLGSGPYSPGFPSPYQDQQPYQHQSGIGSPGSQNLQYSPSQMGTESWQGDSNRVSYLSAGKYETMGPDGQYKFLTPDAARGVVPGQMELEGQDTEVARAPVELPLSTVPAPAPAELASSPHR